MKTDEIDLEGIEQPKTKAAKKKEQPEEQPAQWPTSFPKPELKKELVRMLFSIGKATKRVEHIKMLKTQGNLIKEVLVPNYIANPTDYPELQPVPDGVFTHEQLIAHLDNNNGWKDFKRGESVHLKTVSLTGFKNPAQTKFESVPTEECTIPHYGAMKVTEHVV